MAKGGEVKCKGSKKSRPLCTHCGLHRHSVDKCFKLHGYPPGYKPKSKPTAINQVSSSFGDSRNIPAN